MLLLLPILQSKNVVLEIASFLCVSTLVNLYYILDSSPSSSEPNLYCGNEYSWRILKKIYSPFHLLSILNFIFVLNQSNRKESCLFRPFCRCALTKLCLALCHQSILRDFYKARISKSCQSLYLKNSVEYILLYVLKCRVYEKSFRRKLCCQEIPVCY